MEISTRHSGPICSKRFCVNELLQKLFTFFSKKFQHICVSLDVNFNESLINDVVSFEQLGPEVKGLNVCGPTDG